MKVLFHRNVFDDIDLFKEACLHVLEGKEVQTITCVKEKDKIVFVEKTENIENYDVEDYVELDECKLKDHLEFGLEIERGNFPD